MKLLKDLKSWIVSHHLLNNGWMVGLLVVLALINILVIITSLVRIHQIDVPVPLRFTSIANFDQLGEWYQLYEVMIISLVVVVINTSLSLISYKKSRLASIFLIIVAIIVGMQALAIIYGLTSIDYGLS